MFIPAILSVPVAVGSSAVPTSGAVLPWMLIVAFVGSSLGVLREALRGTARTRMAKERVVQSRLTPLRLPTAAVKRRRFGAGELCFQIAVPSHDDAPSR